MSAARLSESAVEDEALAWLEAGGWQIRNGTEIAPGEPAAERADYSVPALRPSARSRPQVGENQHQ